MKTNLKLLTIISICPIFLTLSSCSRHIKTKFNVDEEEFWIDKQKKSGLYHPTNEREVAVLVKYAKQRHLQVRVRGSAHSVAKAIYTDSFAEGNTPCTEINMVLDRMIGVTFDDSKKEVMVEAGCHLGEDPEDPEAGDFKKSLFYQLDQHGWALPKTGGISHQTVGGFVSTGSAGGSVKFSIGDQIVAIRMVDGNGNILTLSETENPEKFYAAGVSMGLLGVITSVTFKCVDKFHIIGTETTTQAEEAQIDIFGPGDNSRPSLQHFFVNTEHARILWWPQKDVEKMAVWQARQMKDVDYAAIGTTPERFEPRPYELFSNIKPLSKFIQFLAKEFHFEHFDDWWKRTDDPELQAEISKRINFFVTEDLQEFWDTWWHGLPMDIELDDKLLPSEFTEIWIPIEQTEHVMKKLLSHYRTNGLSVTGPYALEIYAAKENRFWMSPSYGEDRVRIDIFWFKDWGNPDKIYFSQFWDLLKDFDCRFHWGKYMPKDPDYLRKQYPKWDEFMDIREEMDPNQIFLTDYWKERLGIPRLSVK